MSSAPGGWSSRRSRPVKSEGDVVDLGAKFGITMGSDSDSSDAEFAPENEERDSADSESESGRQHSSGDEGGDEGGEGNEEEEEGEGEGGKNADGSGETEDVDGTMEVEEMDRKKEGEDVAIQDSRDTCPGQEEVTKVQMPLVQESVTRLEPDAATTESGTISPTNTKEIGTGRDGSDSVEDKRKDGVEDKRKDGEVTKEEYNPLIVRRSNRAIKPTKDVDLYLLGAKFGVDVEGIEGSGAESSDMEFAPTEDSPESVSESSVDNGTKSSGKRTGEILRAVGAEEEGEEEEGMEVGVEASTLQQKAPSEDEYSRSVSELSITQEAVAQVKVDIHVALCAVCLEDSLDGDIVECDHCGISVHEGCYGVPEEAGDDKSSLSSFTTIPWFCDTCKAGVDPTTCACELCPLRGGLFKQATNGLWVHMVCSLYTPGIEYVEPTLLSGVTLDSVSASRWGAKRCQLCEDEFYSKTGVCIGCDAGLCKNFFHATCAQQQGLLCEMDSDEENTDVADPYFAHCRAHSDKTISKRKRRDFLTVSNKQKKFKFNDSDERIQNYLSEARKEYGRFFKKMINYYRPELTAHFEDRFFHFKPSALRRLTRKAQLLGFTVEMEMGGSRRKIAPDLTTEFVNHFSERQSRRKELQELEKKLTSAHRDLREEELKTKHRIVVLEKELNSHRIEGQELKQQATALYQCLSRLSGETVDVPAGGEGGEGGEEGGEGGGEKEMEETSMSGLPECAVCEKVTDTHLMAPCDTCQRYYHIHCLDPPLTRVPKKTSKWGWQCHRCCFESGDDLAPNIANFDEPASRCGRRINAPKVFTFPEDQVKQSKKSTGRARKK